jgi:hypothetical protein
MRVPPPAEEAGSGGCDEDQTERFQGAVLKPPAAKLG